MRKYATNEGLRAALQRILAKQGYDISKLYKGRVVWRSTYGLSFSTDIHFSLEEPTKNAIKISMNVTHSHQAEYDMTEIFQFLLKEGFNVYMERNSIVAVHHSNAF